VIPPFSTSILDVVWCYDERWMDYSVLARLKWCRWRSYSGAICTSFPLSFHGLVWVGGIAIIDSGRLVGGGHCRIFKFCFFVIGGEFYIFWEGRWGHGLRWGGWDC
jgi:hypothetical protein